MPNRMRVGVFTPLLSQLPLSDVLKKLKASGIGTVELGTGNYPGDAHCKLSMLKDRAALATFKKTIADEGFSISALSCHGNPLHPDGLMAFFAGLRGQGFSVAEIETMSKRNPSKVLGLE